MWVSEKSKKIKTQIEKQKNFISKQMKADDNVITRRYLVYEPLFGKTKRYHSPKLYKQHLMNILVNHAGVDNNSL
jgi:hypothetical protein